MWEEKEHRKFLLKHKEETKVKEPLTNHAQLNSTLIQEATSTNELVETDGEPSQSDAVSVDHKHENKEQEQHEEHQEELISPPEQMDLVHEISVSTQQETQQEAPQEPQTELTQQEPQETLQGKTLPEPQQEPQDSHIDGKTEADEKEPKLQEAQNVLPPEPHKDSILETNVEKETEKKTVPEEVALYALTQSTRSLKLRSMMISLDGLLDYDENDKNETTFEVI